LTVPAFAEDIAIDNAMMVTRTRYMAGSSRCRHFSRPISVLPRPGSYG
jgi:hypothetical protein